MSVRDVLAVGPPYSETRSLTSIVNGKSIQIDWLAGKDTPLDSAGTRLPGVRCCSVCSVVNSAVLPKPIDSAPAGTVP